MFDNLQSTQIMETSEEDLLLASGEATKPADKTKVKPAEAKDKSDKSKDKSAPASTPAATVSDLPEDEFKIALGEEADDEDENKDTEDEDKDSEDEDENEEKDENEAKDKDTDPESESTPAEIKDFLKARVDFLIQNGKWADFEGREEVEWDEETFAEIELKQDEVKRSSIREELLDSFGPYGKQIADYSANGGDPDKLIDIFKEQMQLENYSIDTEDQQKELVFKYETEYLGKKPDRVNKYINSLIADKELAEEAKEAKAAIEASLEKQVVTLQKEQEDLIKVQKEKQVATIKNFADSVSTYVSSNTEITPDEKKQILNVLTKFDKKLQNGTPVNDFYFKLADFKKNLPDYIELVRFVLNPKGYKAAEKTKGKNEAAEKTFKLIRTGQKTKALKSTATDETPQPKKSTFKLM